MAPITTELSTLAAADHSARSIHFIEAKSVSAAGPSVCQWIINCRRRSAVLMTSRHVVWDVTHTYTHTQRAVGRTFGTSVFILWRQFAVAEAESRVARRKAMGVSRVYAAWSRRRRRRRFAAWPVVWLREDDKA